MRWWDGTNWTEHVSKPAAAAEPTADVAATVDADAAVTTVPARVEPNIEPAAEPILAPAAERSVAELLGAPSSERRAAAAFEETVEHFATVTYIGRHAAGATPVPRMPSTAPRIRPRVRAEVPLVSEAVPVEAPVALLSYA